MVVDKLMVIEEQVKECSPRTSDHRPSLGCNICTQARISGPKAERFRSSSIDTRSSSKGHALRLLDGLSSLRVVTLSPSHLS